MQRFDITLQGTAQVTTGTLARFLRNGQFQPVEAGLDGFGLAPGDIVLADVGWGIGEPSRMMILSGTDLSLREQATATGTVLQPESGTVAGLRFFQQVVALDDTDPPAPLVPDGVTPPHVFDPSLVEPVLTLTLADPVTLTALAITLDNHGIPRTITGTDGTDVLIGGAGDDLFLPGAGADTLFGQGGQDAISYADQGAGVTLDLRDGLTVNGTFRSLAGSPHDDSLTPGQGVRRIFGGDGNDTLSAGMGVTFLDGEGGSDTAVFTGSSTGARLMGLTGGRIGVLTPETGLTFLTGIETLTFADIALTPEVLTTQAFTLRDTATEPGEGRFDTGIRASEVVFDSNPFQSGSLWGGGGRDVIVTETHDVTADPKAAATVWSYGLYKALLGRAPTGDELARFDETTLIRVNDGFDFYEDAVLDFLIRDEFRNGPLADLLTETAVPGGSALFGDMAFLEAVFRNLLGRDMTEAGRAGWAEHVGTGIGAERLVGTLVTTAFAELRARFTDDLAALNDRMDQGAMLDDLFRLYETALGRLPDHDGMQTWLHRLTTDTSVDRVATSFVTGAEFLSHFGSESDADFIETLYQNAFGRTADAGGLAHWTARLDDGMSRGQLALAIANSPEMQRATTDALDAWVRAQGTDDTILVQVTDITRTGPMTLDGGAWSDSFVFAPAENPENGYGNADIRIADLERWDVVDLTAFGLADHDTLWGALSEESGNVVLDTGDLRLTLTGLRLDDLHDDMVLI